jgi:hypothetical protein
MLFLLKNNAKLCMTEDVHKWDKKYSEYHHTVARTVDLYPGVIFHCFQVSLSRILNHTSLLLDQEYGYGPWYEP